MAAKSKRWNPTPEEVMGAIPLADPGNAQLGPIVGTAQRTRGSTGLQQIGAALKRFNPVLEKYMVGREAQGMQESAQYLREMELGVSNNAYGFKQGLRAAGYSQWRNPHVYRNQIMNVAGLTAYKDADFLRTNAEFLAELEEAKKTDGFADQAPLIAEKHLALHRQRTPENPKEGGYWDAGYAPKWMEARQRLLAPFLHEKVQGDRLEVLENFYENGRNHLLDVIKSSQPGYKDPVTGKVRQPGDPINIKPLRDYISNQWASYPDDDHSFNQAVWTKIVQPVFLDLAADPDNDLLIEQIYDRVMKMSRETRDPKTGKVTSRHSVFGRWKDGASGGGSGTSGGLSEDAFYEKLMDMEAQAHGKQAKREQDEITRMSTGVNLKLKDRATNELSHIPWPYDANGIAEAAEILAADNDFVTKYIRKGGGLHTQLVFRDIVQELGRAIRKADLQDLQTQREYQKELDGKIQGTLSPYIKNTPLFPVIQEMFRNAVGGSKSLDEAKTAAITLLNPEVLVNRFIWDNPTFRPEQASVMVSISAAVAGFADKAALAKSNDLIQMASNLARGNSPVDPYELLAELKDAQNETFDSEDDEALGRAIKMVESHVQISDQWDSLERDKADIITRVIDGSDNNTLKNVIAPQLAWKLKQPTDLDDAQGAALGKPTGLEKEAAHATHDFMMEDMQRQSRRLLYKYHMAHPDPTERANHWKDRGEADLQKDLIDHMRSRAGLYARTYTDHIRRSQEGLAATEKKQRTTLLDTSRKAEDLIADVELRLEDSLNKQSFPQILEDQQAESGRSTAAEIWTGDSGRRLGEALRERQKQRADDLAAGVAKLSKDKRAYEVARDKGDPDITETLRKEMEASTLFVKNMKLLGGTLNWQDWVDDKGNIKQGADLNLNVTDADGGELPVPFNLVGDNINPSTHLLVGSWSDFDTFPNEINAIETLTAVGKEYTPSGKTEGLFKLWQLMTGNDIDPRNYDLSFRAKGETTDPKNFVKIREEDRIYNNPEDVQKLREVHNDFDMKWRGQVIKFMARRRNDLPDSVTSHIQNSVTAEFLTSDDTNFQGTSWNEGEKEHFSRFMEHNDRMLANVSNIEDGITWEQFVNEYYPVVTNGLIPVYPYKVKANGEISSGRDRDGWGREYIDDERRGRQLDSTGGIDWKWIPVDPKPSARQQFPEHGDVENTAKILEDAGLPFDAIPRRDRIGRQLIIAQELALAEMNFEQPTNLPDQGWAWPRIPSLNFSFGTGLSVDRAKFEERTQYWNYVLRSGPETNSERAKGFNMLLRQSGLGTDNYLGKKNVFGIAPLSIPHKKVDRGPRIKPWGARTKAEQSETQVLNEGGGIHEKAFPRTGADIAREITERNAFGLRDRLRSIPETRKQNPNIKSVPERKPKHTPAPPATPVDPELKRIQKDMEDKNAFGLKKPENVKKVPRRNAPKGSKSVLSKEGKASLLHKLKNPKQRTAAESILETLKPTPKEAQRIIDEMTKRNAFDLKTAKKVINPRAGLTGLEFGKGVKKKDKK